MAEYANDVLVDTQFASYLEEGSVTAIYYADRVMELVLGGYAVAVSTVILPLLSRQAALRQMDELKTTIQQLRCSRKRFRIRLDR